MSQKRAKVKVTYMTFHYAYPPEDKPEWSTACGIGDDPSCWRKEIPWIDAQVPNRKRVTCEACKSYLRLHPELGRMEAQGQ